MKTVNTGLIPSIALLLLVARPPFAEAGLILTQGQSFEFEFSSMAPTTPFPDDPFGFAGFSLGFDRLKTGESVLFSVFENNTSQSPIRSGAFNGVGAHPGDTVGGGFLTSAALAPWQDRQGVFRIEVVSGTIELKTLNAATVIGSQYYEQTYAIPEPNSIVLIAIGTGILYLRRKRCSNLHNEPTRSIGHRLGRDALR